MSRFICFRKERSFDDKRRLMKIKLPFDDLDNWNPKGDLNGETPDAYGFKINGVKNWMPKSQMKNLDNQERSITIESDCFRFFLPYWLMVEKGFEVFLDTSDEPGLFDNQE